MQRATESVFFPLRQRVNVQVAGGIGVGIGEKFVIVIAWGTDVSKDE